MSHMLCFLLSRPRSRFLYLAVLLGVSATLHGREFTKQQFTTYTDFGSYGGFEGAQITVMRGGDKTYLVKPFIAAQECTNAKDGTSISKGANHEKSCVCCISDCGVEFSRCRRW
jgi:hypothetical protein